MSILQLLIDITYATENVSWPHVKQELCIYDWVSEEEEDNTAPIRKLEEWTGISKIQLPPPYHDKFQELDLYPVP